MGGTDSDLSDDLTSTEVWGGTSWSASATLNTGRCGLAGGGGTTNAICMGGSVGGWEMTASAVCETFTDSTGSTVLASALVDADSLATANASLLRAVAALIEGGSGAAVLATAQHFGLGTVEGKASSLALASVLRTVAALAEDQSSASVASRSSKLAAALIDADSSGLANASALRAVFALFDGESLGQADATVLRTATAMAAGRSEILAEAAILAVARAAIEAEASLAATAAEKRVVLSVLSKITRMRSMRSNLR